MDQSNTCKALHPDVIQRFGEEVLGTMGLADILVWINEKVVMFNAEMVNIMCDIRTKGLRKAFKEPGLWQDKKEDEDTPEE